MMTVKELKQMLKKYPDDMEILVSRMSDYTPIKEDEWSIIKGVMQQDGYWVMRSHPTMSTENKKNEKEYLYLEGN